MALSQAVIAGRARRAGRAGRRDLQIRWFIDNVMNEVNLTMDKRMAIATEVVRDKVVRNISKPVTKTSRSGRNESTGRFQRAGTSISDRSRAGEFPKADTTRLMKDIFGKVVKGKKKGVAEGYVGTTLDYGLILETRMDRSFLERTLNEERDLVRRILTARIR